MKRNATVILGTVLLLIIHIGTYSSAEPMAGIMINKMNVNAIAYENTSVKVTINAEVVVSKEVNRSINSLVFPAIPAGIVEDRPYKGIEMVRSLTENVSASIIKTQGYAYAVLVKFKGGLGPNEVKNFTFSFVFKPRTILVRTDSMYRMVYRFYMPNTTVDYNRSVMRIKLPSGAAVTKIENFGAVEMEETDPLSKRLVAVWSPFPKPLGYGWDFAVEFRIAETSSTMREMPSTITHNKVSNNASNEERVGLSLMQVLILVLLSNSMVGVAALIFYRRALRGFKAKDWSDISRSRDQETVLLDDESIQMYREQLKKLDTDERGIIDILMDRDGKIEQKDLPELTGFSKSKVSRILKRLDSSGIVRRTSAGRSKIVELNPAIMKVLQEYEGA